MTTGSEQGANEVRPGLLDKQLADAVTASTPPTAKAPTRTSTTRKTTASRTTKKTTTRAPAKKTTARKVAATDTAATTAAKKSASTKKATARRAPAKKAAAAPPVKISTTHRHHPYRTLDERVARGLAWREVAPHEGMAEFTPAPQRPSALGLLSAQDDARVPELLPIRYGRMATSTFAYYRGSAAVMAYDLAQQPYTPGGTQICGDAHLSNFGFFGSPERDLVFDVNDFDETLPGPFEWDVKRLAASVVLAGRDRGFTKKEIRSAARAATEGYQDVARRLAASSNMEVWYTKVDSALIEQAIVALAAQEGGRKLAAATRKRLDLIFAKARGKTSLRAAAKLTEVVDGHRRFRDDPPLLVRTQVPPELAAEMERVFVDYKDTLQNDRRRLVERFQFQDLAHKVVGVGSVGTRALIMLLEGRDPEDLLILQIKQAQQSVLEQYLRPSTYENHGQRVVEGQRYMQTVSDIFLGWLRGPAGRDFYVRQLHDMKGSLDLTTIRPEGLRIYARLCGGTLARAHARGGDIVAIASYIGEDDTFSRAVAKFGERYAAQAALDYQELVDAISAGKVAATGGI